MKKNYKTEVGFCKYPLVFKMKNKAVNVWYRNVFQ